MREIIKSTAANSDLVFHDEFFRKNEELQEKFRAVGPDGFLQVGIVAEKLPKNELGYKSLLHFANPYSELTVDDDGNVTGDAKMPLTIVSFPSYATVEEIEELRSNLIPMPETCEILQALAEAKEMNNMILIIAGTAVGKTFAVNTFVKCLYGPEAHPFDFYCNGQTDVSELHGMWVPKLTGEKEALLWRDFLESNTGAEKMEEIGETLDSTKELPEEQRIKAITEQLKRLAAEIGLSTSTAWEFSPGGLPKCYNAVYDPEKRRVVDFRDDGRGFPLHIQEVGLAQPRVTNALLETGGAHGRLNDSIQIWRNGGMQIFRGPDTMIIMTTNPEEQAGYKERNELDKALLRRLMTLELPENLSRFSLHLAAMRYFTYQSGNRPESRPHNCVLELYNYPDDIGKVIATVVSAFHHSFTQAFKNGEGRGKASRAVTSIDQMSRMADYMLHFQVFDRDTGNPDLVTTLKRGIDRVYLGAISTSRRDEQRRFLNQLLNGDVVLNQLKSFGKTPAVQLRDAVAEHMKTQRENHEGFSPELASEVRKARARNLRVASDELRNEIGEKDGVAEGIKKKLFGWRK